jgi:hypothetical protein
MEAASIGKKNAKPNYRCSVLRLPDLDHSKLAVLNSLTSPRSRRVYQHAIEQFIAWYCSEPRLAFNRIVVVRHRMRLESRCLAANTINQHLAVVRRLAYEAADAELLSPDLAAGIGRVKGVKQLGQRSGNWLTLDALGDSLSGQDDLIDSFRRSWRRRYRVPSALRTFPLIGFLHFLKLLLLLWRQNGSDLRLEGFPNLLRLSPLLVGSEVLLQSHQA